MDWNARVRAAFAGAAAVPDDDVVEELGQHARAVYDAARAEGLSQEDADRRVSRAVGSLAARRSRPAPPGTTAASRRASGRDVLVVHRRPRPGRAVCGATAAAPATHRAARRTHDGARHRRYHRSLQPHLRRSSETACLAGGRIGWWSSRKRAAAELRASAHSAMPPSSPGASSPWRSRTSPPGRCETRR